MPEDPKPPVQPPANPEPPKPPATPPAPPAPATPPAEPPKPPAGPPATYDLKLAEGSPLDPKGDVEKIVAYAKAQGLSNEQAQALLTHEHEVAAGLVSRQQTAFTEQVKNWGTTTWADKELGGANKDTTLANVKRAMDKFAPDGSPFQKFLNESGYGNHPEWVRFVNSVGKAMAEDKPLGQPAGSGSDPNKKKSLAERMFPEQARS